MVGREPVCETIYAADKTEIFLRRWPVDKPKAVLVICHGMGEHGGRYGNVVDLLVPAGYAIYIHDHRGHGRSGGRRGHVDRFDQYLDDAYLVVAKAREAYPDKKVFLLGHSLGGLIALTYALRHGDTLDGVISASALLKLAVKVPVVKEALGKVMASIWPTLTMGNGLDAKDLSHDQKVVQEYIDDPLVHDRVTASWYQEMVGAADRTINGAGALTMPLLIWHGDADAINALEGSKMFYDRAGSADKKWVVFPGMFHEVLNETEKEKALNLLLTWLSEHS